ncbi:hypothetical protein XH96_04685 [Bradyrhizobium sp. CCBAU 51765]|nr:hypothetical protein XH96_04685 [Bradyrhizobium sp. CCBAU 51765]
MSRIQIPQELLERGPIGYRVQIVDYDATEDRFHGAHELPAALEQEPAAWKSGSPSIVHDFRFHAQNVYALVMKTLSRFEYALGRRIGWSFRTHQIKIAPHGMLDANAFYTPDAEGLVFGYFLGRSGAPVYTCLSHDVVVHETTHALLDALRERYLDPSSADQAAFHEGFSDVIALLSVFAQRELVLELLRGGRTRTKGVPNSMMRAADAGVDALKAHALFALAQQMGQELEGVRGSALRNSASIPLNKKLRDSAEYREPHRRGELLVAAVLHAFISVWAKRIKDIAIGVNALVPLERVAEEGADIADLMVTMWIRGLDYMPPVHVEFGDALSGALTADQELRPDDQRYELRAQTKAAFEAYGFRPAAGTLSGTWQAPPLDLDYSNVRFESMRTDKDEIFRFLWDNRTKFALRPGAYTEVLSVRPCTRIGEDGFTLHETVAEYYQVARLTPKELRAEKIKLPPGFERDLKEARRKKTARSSNGSAPLGAHQHGGTSEELSKDDDSDVTPLYGGGTLIFDDYGRLKYWIHNDVFGSRQSDRLKYLYEAGLLRASKGGARLSAARLSAVHRLRALDSRRFPQEGW